MSASMPPPIEVDEKISVTEMNEFLSGIKIKLDDPVRLTKQINEIIAAHQHGEQHLERPLSESKAHLETLRKHCSDLLAEMRSIDDEELLSLVSADDTATHHALRHIDELTRHLEWFSNTLQEAELEVPHGRPPDKSFNLTATRVIRLWSEASGLVGSIGNPDYLDQYGGGRSLQFYRFVGEHLGWTSLCNDTLRRKINDITRNLRRQNHKPENVN